MKTKTSILHIHGRQRLGRAFLVAFALSLSLIGASDAIAQQSTISARIQKKIEYMPPLVQGDKEFSGNGPDVKVSVKYFVENGALQAQVYMFARETKSNWTTARGLSPKVVVFRPQRGYRVVRIAEARTYYKNIVNYRMRGHRPKTFVTSLGDIQVFGDRKGKDVGYWTKVIANLDHRMRVVIEPIGGGGEPASRTITVRRPQTITIIPPHTNGDRDFHGNGPHVQVSANLYTQKGQFLFLRVNMRARETEPDNTTADGGESYLIYEAPRGYRIDRIIGQTTFRNLVDDIDQGHSSKSYDTAIGKIVVVGDTKGDEAGTKTRAVIDFRWPIRIVLVRD